MDSEPFKIDYEKIRSGDYVARYCINRISELKDLTRILETMKSTGGLGGDVDWGVHKSDEYCQEDYGVNKFEGWRFYIGPEESPNHELVDCYLNEEEFIELLEQAFPSLDVKLIF